MKTGSRFASIFRSAWKDTRGQDLIEYALLAGFIALSVGALVPGIAGNVSTVISKVNSVISGDASSSNL